MPGMVGSWLVGRIPSSGHNFPIKGEMGGDNTRSEFHRRASYQAPDWLPPVIYWSRDMNPNSLINEPMIMDDTYALFMFSLMVDLSFRPFQFKSLLNNWKITNSLIIWIKQYQVSGILGRGIFWTGGAAKPMEVGDGKASCCKKTKQKQNKRKAIYRCTAAGGRSPVPYWAPAGRSPSSRSDRLNWWPRVGRRWELSVHKTIAR